MQRELATIEVVSSVDPIFDADSIERIGIKGWGVVDRKGVHKVGDKVVFFEIDSWMPASDPRYAFLMARGVKRLDGVEGQRLKTIRFRGCISQGLVLPISEFPECADLPVGSDVTELLTITKWQRRELVVDGGLGAIDEIGGLPAYVPKTGEYRVQNKYDAMLNFMQYHAPDTTWEASMKLEGTSMSFAMRSDVELTPIGLYTHTSEISLDPETRLNSYLKIFRKRRIQETLDRFRQATGRILTLQSELMGPKIEGNIEGFTDLEFYVFKIWDSQQKRQLLPKERIQTLELINHYADFEILGVPIVEPELDIRTLDGLNGLLKFADGPSINAKRREGIVLTANTANKYGELFSVKVISNDYLLNGQK